MAKGVYIGVEKKPTLMLLHGDDLTESANNLPVTNNSVTVVDDSGAFGGKALNFSGSGQHLSITDDTLSLPGDFTIDFRLYNAGSTSWRGIFETAGATSSNWTFHKGGLNISLGDGSNLLFAGIAKGGGTYSTLNTPANSVPVGTWSHIALVRSNGVMTFYINGVSSASLSDSEAVTTDGTILIGKHDIRDDMYLNGKIDEFRVSSVARWTSNFTPPTEAYPNDEAGVGIARKVKKMYYGVGNLAKEIKKGYIGIGGVARPFWTSGPGEPMFYGKVIDANDYGIDGGTTAFNSKYALFIGSGEDGYRGAAFSEDLTVTSFYYPLGIAQMSGCTFQDYAVFLGGTNTNPYDRTYNSVYTYDVDLVAQKRTALPTIDLGNASYEVSTGKVNDNLVAITWQFRRNQYDYGPFTVSYDQNFIQSRLTTPSRLAYFAGTQNDNYALFIGGIYNSNVSNIVQCFNSSLIKSTTTCSAPSFGESSMEINGLGCRLGEIRTDQYGDYVDNIEGFDKDLIRSTPSTVGFSDRSYSSYVYSGIFKGVPYVKGYSFIYEFDSDFVKTTYNYTIPEGSEYPYYRDSETYYKIRGTVEQLLNPVGDYLLFEVMEGMGTADAIYAFKFS